MQVHDVLVAAREPRRRVVIFEGHLLDRGVDDGVVGVVHDVILGRLFALFSQLSPLGRLVVEVRRDQALLA